MCEPIRHCSTNFQVCRDLFKRTLQIYRRFVQWCGVLFSSGKLSRFVVFKCDHPEEKGNRKKRKRVLTPFKRVVEFFFQFLLFIRKVTNSFQVSFRFSRSSCAARFSPLPVVAFAAERGQFWPMGHPAPLFFRKAGRSFERVIEVDSRSRTLSVIKG